MAARLFGADRVSVWLIDRRARMLELVASSDGGRAASTPPRGHRRRGGSRVQRRCAARRVERVKRPPAHTPDVLAPLRGRRRALGTLELRGVRIQPGDGGAAARSRRPGRAAHFRALSKTSGSSKNPTVPPRAREHIQLAHRILVIVSWTARCVSPRPIAHSPPASAGSRRSSSATRPGRLLRA